MKSEEYGTGRAAATVALCAILFLSMASAGAVLILRGVLNERSISEAAAEIDVFAVVDELGVYDTVLGIIETNAGFTPDIPRDAVMDVLNSEPVRAFVSENLQGYANALAKGEEDYVISNQSVVGLIRRVSDFVYEETGYLLDERAIGEIENFLAQYEVLENISLSALTASSPVSSGLLGFLRFLMKPGTLIAPIVLSFSALLGVVLVNMKHIRKGLLGLCITSFLASLPCFAAGLSLYGLFSMLAGDSFGHAMADIFLARARNTALMLGVCFVAAGAALIAAVIYIDNKTVKKATKRGWEH